MSDESQPPAPSLRLRPRLSASENEADSEVGAKASRADPSASPGGVGEGASPPQKTKIRLRPRLNAEPTVHAPRSADSPVLLPDELLSPAAMPPAGPQVPSATVPAADAVDSVPTIRLKPRSTTENELEARASNAAHSAPSVALPASSSLPAPGAAPSSTVPDAIIPSPSAKEPAVAEVNALRKALTPEGVKLKLRSGDAVIGDPAMLVGALPENPIPGEGSSAPLVPPTPGPVIKRTPPPFPVLATAPKLPPPRIPHLAARESSSLRSEGRVRKSKGMRRLVVLLCVAVAGGGAYFGWTRLKSSPQGVAPAAVAPKSVTPSETLNALASVPFQAVRKAQEVLAVRQEGVRALVDAMATEKEGVSKQAPRPSVPVPVPPPLMAGATATTTVAPGLSASMPIAAAADASAAFREFVANAKISGVADTRALINGRLVRIGEIVDPTLGIRFQAVDRETKQLIFRDFSGAQVGRRF